MAAKGRGLAGLEPINGGRNCAQRDWARRDLRWGRQDSSWSLRRLWRFSAHQQMQCSHPPTAAALLPRSNMTAPENNFCCATDLAPMSEPVAYGVGTIGIVSCRFNGWTVQAKWLWSSTHTKFVVTWSSMPPR